MIVFCSSVSERDKDISFGGSSNKHLKCTRNKDVVMEEAAMLP